MSPPCTAQLQAYFTYLEKSTPILCKPLVLESLFLRVNPYSLPWDLMKLNGSHLTKSPSCFKALLWLLRLTLKLLSMALKALHDMSPLPLQPWLSHCTPLYPSQPRRQPAEATHSSPCHPGTSHFWSFAHATLFSRNAISPLALFSFQCSDQVLFPPGRLQGPSQDLWCSISFLFAVLAPWNFLILCERNTPVSMSVCLPSLRPQDRDSAWFICARQGLCNRVIHNRSWVKGGRLEGRCLLVWK